MTRELFFSVMYLKDALGDSGGKLHAKNVLS